MGQPGHLQQPIAAGALGSLAIGDTVTGGTSGSVLFVGSGPVLAQDNAAFFWDATNKILIMTRAAATGVTLAAKVTGDAANRFVITADGAHYWGDGATLTGPKLYRSSGGTITIERNDGSLGAVALAINTLAGVVGSLSLRSSGVGMWTISRENAESGANAGADFKLKSFADGGAALRTDLTITRSSGLWEISGTVQPVTTNAQDLGATGKIWRSAYFGTSVINSGQYLGNPAGVISFASAAIATNATTGWLTIPSCAGAPTGVPANLPTGQVGLVYDSTNNKLYVYNGGWKKAQVTAVDAIYA